MEEILLLSSFHTAARQNASQFSSDKSAPLHLTGSCEMAILALAQSMWADCDAISIDPAYHLLRILAAFVLGMGFLTWEMQTTLLFILY